MGEIALFHNEDKANSFASMIKPQLYEILKL